MFTAKVTRFGNKETKIGWAALSQAASATSASSRQFPMCAIDWRLVDAANRKIIKTVLYGLKKGLGFAVGVNVTGHGGASGLIIRSLWKALWASHGPKRSTNHRGCEAHHVARIRPPEGKSRTSRPAGRGCQRRRPRLFGAHLVKCWLWPARTPSSFRSAAARASRPATSSISMRPWKPKTPLARWFSRMRTGGGGRPSIRAGRSQQGFLFRRCRGQSRLGVKAKVSPTLAQAQDCADAGSAVFAGFSSAPSAVK